ncbi:MAG: hypothetical protein JO222_00635, partial [Frankiales bacterium]|nr:hypothetical protein [Frankiales bacterium]
MRTVRTLAAVTAAALAPIAVASSAMAGDQPGHRAPTGVGIAVADRTISPGDSDTVLGRLHRAGPGRQPGLPGHHVVLLAKAPGTNTWSKVADGTTKRHGYVFFTVTPASTTRYEVAFPRTPRLRGSHSRPITIFVGQPSDVTASATSSSINPGETDTINAVLTSNGTPLAGQTLVLRARPNGHRRGHEVATATTDSNGAAAFPVTPGRTTHYRVVFRGAEGDNPAVSNPVRVIVRRPTSLSIREKTLNNGKTVVSGVLLAPRHPLANRMVSLMASPAGTNTWTTVDTKPTGPHGYVFFTVTPASTTRYEVAFPRTPRL